MNTNTVALINVIQTLGASEYESYGPGATFTQPSLIVGLLPVNVEYEFKIYAGNNDGWYAYMCISYIFAY
jgi:hypothetical protein